MKIGEQIDHLRKMKAGKEPSEIEIIDEIISSLSILKNSFTNSNSEAVIISMNHADYVLFEEFKSFKKFTVASAKVVQDDPVMESAEPVTEELTAQTIIETPEQISE